MKSVINATVIIAINTLISVRLHATALSNHDCNLDQCPQCFFLFKNGWIDTFPSGFPSIRFGHECAIYYKYKWLFFSGLFIDISIFNPHPLFRESHPKTVPKSFLYRVSQCTVTCFKS